MTTRSVAIALLLAALVLAPCAWADETSRDSGKWKVKFDHPATFAKGDRVCIRVHFEYADGVPTTQKIELTVRLNERDVAISNVISHEKEVPDGKGGKKIERQSEFKFTFETKPDAVAFSAIKGTAEWSCTLADYELLGGVELYATIDAKNVSFNKATFAPGAYSSKKNVVKVKRAGEADHKNGCDCDDCKE